MRFDKPIGILLLLWPTLWALWIAGKGFPPWPVLLIFVLGVVLMRAAGCVINDFADRHFDAHVERTKNRPLATGEVSAKAALVLFASLMLCAFLLILFLNALTIKLALVGAVLATIYPFSKRFIAMPQFVLGLAFAWGIPMAFAALTGAVPAMAWLLFAIGVLWPLAYDTQYAMVDRNDDVKIGIKSTAILFGRCDRLMIALMQIVIIFLFVVLGLRLDFSIWFYFALSVAVLLMIYQHFLIRHRDRTACFRAFLNNHWVGLIIFCGIFIQK